MGFQPWTYEDFGKAENRAGFDYAKGRKELTHRRDRFLLRKEELEAAVGDFWGRNLKDDFFQGIKNEKSWQTLDYFEREKESGLPKFDMETAFGEHCMEIFNLGLNSALYAQRRDAPGHLHGNQVLLERSLDRNSVLYEAVDASLQKRIVNGAFWEFATENNPELLKKVLTDFSGLIDPVYFKEGLKSFQRGIKAYAGPVNPAVRVDLQYIERKGIITFGRIIGQAAKELRETMNLPQTFEFLNAFVIPYIEVAHGRDGQEHHLFVGDQGQQLINLLGINISLLHKNFANSFGISLD